MEEIPELKNILVYRVGHLGDTIVALPAFWKIRKKFPNAKITLLTNSDEKNKNYIMAKSILPAEGLFDSIISYNNAATKLNKIVVFTKLFARLKSKNFDGLFYLSTRLREHVQIDRDLKFFRAVGIKNIFGTEFLKKNNLTFDCPRPLPSVIPEYEFLLNCLPFEKDVNNCEINTNLRLTAAEKNKACTWLEENCGQDFLQGKLLAVAPGSKWDSKKWFEERFAGVLEKLIAKYDILPVIFGGQEDFETGQRIIQKLSKGVNSAGKLNIREASAAIENCRLYLGNDTGTMHMAAAVGTPCIALFAAIDFENRWYPFGKNNRVIRYSVECEGCHTPDCFNHHKCLSLITAEEVYKVCSEILEK